MEKSGKITCKCSNCTASIPTDDVRYSKDGKSIICIDCHNIIFGKKSLSSRMSILPNPRRDPLVNKLVMLCEDCRYRFRASRKSDKEHHCPNCDSVNIIPYETDIEKILKDL